MTYSRKFRRCIRKRPDSPISIAQNYKKYALLIVFYAKLR